MKTRHDPARPLAPRFDDDDEDGEDNGDEKKESAAKPLLKRLLETRTVLLTGQVAGRLGAVRPPGPLAVPPFELSTDATEP